MSSSYGLLGARTYCSIPPSRTKKRAAEVRSEWGNQTDSNIHHRNRLDYPQSEWVRERLSSRLNLLEAQKTVQGGWEVDHCERCCAHGVLSKSLGLSAVMRVPALAGGGTKLSSKEVEGKGSDSVFWRRELTLWISLYRSQFRLGHRT